MQTLKTWPKFFDLIWEGKKKCEIRSTSDRVFSIGDRLRLMEHDNDRYTGREIYAVITHVLDHSDFPSGLQKGYCCISFVVESKYLGVVEVK
jgi:uncharacterized protein YqfB (UPF0267 family)